MQINEYPGIGERLACTVLPNGLRVMVVPKKGFRSYYAVLAVNYGGACRRFRLGGELRDTPAGVAHFLEHKMFDLPNGDNALNLLSANGADPNAFTSNDTTCYFFQCTEGFEENLRLLLHFVATPYFTEETVSKEQGIIAQEIQMGEDSPGNAIYYNLLSMLYSGHPVKDKIAGTLESIACIDHNTLYDCYGSFYVPCNMALCVEGDVSPERIAAIAARELGGEGGSAPQAELGDIGELIPKERLCRAQMSVSAPQFLIGAKFRPEAGGAELQRQRLTAQLSMRLLAGASSPFYTGLYADGLLGRDYEYEADFVAGTGTVLIGGESSEPERVLEELKKAVERVKNQGFDDERFLRAKRASLGARLRGFEDFENVCVSLAQAAFLGYCPMNALELLDTVTKEECRSFVCSTLAPERLCISIIEPGKG